jgi:hypothetical protein
MLVHLFGFRHSGEHYSYEDNSHYGRWGIEETVFSKLGRGARNGYRMAPDFSWLRAYRFSYGLGLYENFLIRIC